MKFANFLRIKERRSQMKKLFVFGSIFLLILAGNAYAWTVGNNGADGAFDLSVTPQVAPSYVTINSTTKTATVTLPSTGIMNLTKMNVPTGWTVTFINNAANTPVYIEASDMSASSVIINGTINVSGWSVGCVATPGDGGPGGYAGGYGGETNGDGGKGLGPGGGTGGWDSNCRYGGGGGYGTAGGTRNCPPGGPSYGNANIMPVIGGSGGGGGFGCDGHPGYGGAGGGGAIVIASSGTIAINGSIQANGGSITCSDWGGNGSGGAIKLMASYITGSGTLSAKGGNPTWSNRGGQGRIRLETDHSNTFIGSSDPAYTLDYSPGSVIPANQPKLSITSIAGQPVPAAPIGSYSSPDITLLNGSSNVVTVNISAQNIPTTSAVNIIVIPQYGSTSQYGAILTGNQTSSLGSTTVTLSTEYPNVVVAETTFIMQQAMYYDNEKIEKVRVAAAMGKESETIYITESGKEIPAKVLKLAGLIK
jgi:hypothetical protein